MVFFQAEPKRNVFLHPEGSRNVLVGAGMHSPRGPAGHEP